MYYKIKDYYTENISSICVVDEEDNIVVSPEAFYEDPEDYESEVIGYGAWVENHDEPVEFDNEDDMVNYIRRYAEEHNEQEDEIKFAMYDSVRESRELFIMAELKKVTAVNMSCDPDYTVAEFKEALSKAIRFFNMSLELVWNREKFHGFLP